MADDNNIPDVQQGLDQLTNETTAADLIRQHGQHRRLQTVSRSKLIGWMQRAVATELNQALGSRQAEISDEEKQRIQEQALSSVQGQLQQYKQESAAAQKRAEDLQQQYEEATQAAEGNQELQEALANLQEQANRAEQRANEQQNDLFELEDRFNENAEMLNATIAEKDRLQTTNRELLMRGTEVVQIALYIDQNSYGGRHQREYDERDIEHEEGKEFFADFDVAGMVLKSLKADLAKLHKLTYKIEEEVPEAAKALLVESTADGTQRYTYDSGSAPGEARLAKDLDLINHLQEGQLGGHGAVDADQAQLLIRIADACITKVPGEAQDEFDEEDENAPQEPGDVLQVKLQRVHELFGEQLERNKQLATEINASSEEQSSLQKSKQELEESMEEERVRQRELEELAEAGREMVPILTRKIEKIEEQLKEERSQRLSVEKERENYQQQVLSATEAEQKLAEAIAGFQEVIADETGATDSPIATSVGKLQSRLQELPVLDVGEDAEVAPIRPHLFEDIANDGIAVINLMAQETYNRRQKEENLQQDLKQRQDEVRQKDELLEKIGEANRGLIAAVNAIPGDESPPEVPGSAVGIDAGGNGKPGTGQAWDELEDFPDADSDNPEDIDAVLAEGGEDELNDDLVLLDDFDSPENLIGAAQEAAARAQGNVTRLNERLQTLESETAQLKSDLESKDTQLAAKNEELAAKETELGERAEKLDLQERQYQEAEASLIALRDEKVQIETRAGELEQQLEEARSETRRLQEEADGSRTRIEELETQLEDAGRRAEEAAARIADLEPQLEEAHSRIGRLEPELEDATNKVGELEGQLVEAHQEREDRDRELQSARDEIAKVQEEKGLIEETLKTKERELGELSELAAARQTELDQGAQRIESLEADKQELEQRTQQAEEQVITLEAMQANLAETVAGMARLQAEAVAAIEEESDPTAEIVRSCSELDQAKEAINQGEESPRRLAEASESLLGHLKAQNQRVLSRLNETRDELTRAETQREQLSTQVESLRSDTEGQQSRIADLKQLLKQSRAAIEEVKAREESASAGIREELEKTREQRQDEESRLNAEIQHLGERLSEQTEELAQLRQRTDELAQQLEASEQEKTELQEQLDASSQERVEISALHAKIEGLEKKNRELLALQDEEISHSGRVHQLVEEVQQVQNQRNELKQRMRSVQAELADERGKTEGLFASRDQIRAESVEQIKHLQERLSQAQAEIETTRSQLQKQAETNAGLEAKVRSLTAIDDDDELGD